MSCAGLTRASITFAKIYAKRMDPRVKPAGDGSGWASADSNRPGTAVAVTAGSIDLAQTLHQLSARNAAMVRVSIEGKEQSTVIFDELL